jgi:hypothetical protein
MTPTANKPKTPQSGAPPSSICADAASAKPTDANAIAGLVRHRGRQRLSSTLGQHSVPRAMGRPKSGNTGHQPAVLPDPVARPVGADDHVWVVLERCGVVGDLLIGGPGRSAGPGRAVDVVLRAGCGPGDARVALYSPASRVTRISRLASASITAATAAQDGLTMRLDSSAGSSD